METATRKIGVAMSRSRPSATTACPRPARTPRATSARRVREGRARRSKSLQIGGRLEIIRVVHKHQQQAHQHRCHADHDAAQQQPADEQLNALHDRRTRHDRRFAFSWHYRNPFQIICAETNSKMATKTIRSTRLSILASTREPATAPSTTPRATGAVMKGSTSPRAK